MNKLILLLITLTFPCFGMHPPTPQRSLSSRVRRSLVRRLEAQSKGRASTEPSYNAGAATSSAADTKRSAAQRFDWNNIAQAQPEQKHDADTVALKEAKPTISCDELFACTGFNKETQRLIKEYTFDPLEVFPAVVQTCDINCDTRKFALMPDGNIAVMTNVKAIRIFDINSGSCIKTINPEGILIHKSMHCMPNGQILTYTTRLRPYIETDLKIWNPAYIDTCVKSLNQNPNNHPIAYRIINVMPDNRIIIGYGDGMIQIWHPESDQLVNLTGHTRAITSIVILSDGTIATAAHDSTIRIWNPTTGTCLSAKRYLNSPLEIQATKEGNIISRHEDGDIYAWDIFTDQLKKIDQSLSPLDMNKIKITGNNVIIHKGKKLALWDTACTASKELVLVHHKNGIDSGLDDHLITFCDQGIKIWDHKVEHCLTTLPGTCHSILVNDTTLIAMSSLQQSLRVYRLCQKAIAELHTLSLTQFEALKKLIAQLEQVKGDNCLPTLLSGAVAQELMALPRHMRSCLAAYYQVTTAELEKEYGDISEGTALPCTIL